MVLLRLAVMLNRDRSDRALPVIEAVATEDKITLLFPPDWLSSHRLTATGLETEKKILKNLSIKLRYS